MNHPTTPKKFHKGMLRTVYRRLLSYSLFSTMYGVSDLEQSQEL